jgi:hypothetical protein
MSTLTDTGFPTLANWFASQNPDGSIAHVANLLAKKRPILDKIPWVEGNLPTGHLITQSNVSLPSGTWRALNAGVVATDPKTEQYTESCGILESWSKVDCALANLNGNAAAYRAMKDDLKVEGLGQQLSTAIFYESVTTNPERIHGLAPRYPGSSGYTASSYTLVGTNAGVNAQSVWLLTPELGKFYGIYPKGSMMGLQKNDLGKQVVTDSNGASFLAFMTQLVWNCGIAVEDFRYLVRGQWDPDDAAYADNDRGLCLLMQQMADTIFERTANTFFVMNRTSKKKLRAQLGSNDANFLSQVVLPNRGPVDHFDGIPIYVDDMLVAETAIS